MFMTNYQCKQCTKSFNSYDSLRKHAGRIHKISSTNFYVDFYLNGVWPTCKCGCGEKVKWSAKNKKFCDLLHGHYSRIHNNWGHNQKAINASAKTRREQYASGERKAWNDGLDIADPRVRKNSERSKQTINTSPEELARRSLHMQLQWQSGNMTILSGSSHPNWQGGVSSINQLARADHTLYTEWKLPILKRDKFKCTKCQETENLHVHHDKETFSEIIKKVMTIDDFERLEEFGRKREVANRVVEYHIKHPVSGITLCQNCHAEIHPQLNFD